MNFLLTSYEPGMTPGPGLSAAQTFITFVVAPVALFLIIGAFAFASGTKRDKKKSVVDSID